MDARTRSVACVIVLALAFVCALPVRAWALTTNKATAKPNEDGGSEVIGGLPTRLTWEGTVEEGEKVSSIHLEIPEDGSFAESTTKVTALEGLSRASVESEVSADNNTLTVSFGEPIGEGLLVRLENYNMTLPSAGGDVVVSGTYQNQNGEQKLKDSEPAIKTIANTPLQTMVNWLDNQEWVKQWNANQFLGMFLKPQLVLTSLSSLFPGWLLCLGIVIASYPFAILLGLVFALMKISRHRLVRAIAIIYINTLRGTPLFLQIYIMFFGLPMMNINIDNNVLGIIVMAINSSAYLAEIFRAGIESIPQGQYEAAASLGMGHLQTMVNVILPQTIRRVIPTVTSDFIMAFKDTSLLSSVGVMELMMFSKNLTSVTGNMTPYVTAAIFYLIVTLPLIKVVSTIEKRMAKSERGGGPRPKAKAKKTEVAEDEAQAVGTEPSLVEALSAPFKAGTSVMGGTADVR